MAKFVVILKCRKEGRLSKDLLHQHVEHLKKLHASGNLILCGPFKTSAGAIQVLEADNIKTAMDLVELDPFIKHNYYQEFELEELIEANTENNFLLSDTEVKIKNRE